jgi:small subunit ribosomal protein S14
MAKKNMIEREKKRERLVTKYEKKRSEIKNELKTISSYQKKLELYAKLQALPRNSFPCRLRNRCWLTGRSRGYYRDFGLSRHVLREMSHACLLPGVTKSSW